MTTAQDPERVPEAPLRGRSRLLPFVLLAAVVMQWVTAGGPPVRYGSIVPGLLYTGMVLSFVVASFVASRAAVRAAFALSFAFAVAMIGVQGWFVAQGVARPVTLLPYALLLAFWAWVWTTMRPRAAPRVDGGASGA